MKNSILPLFLISLFSINLYAITDQELVEKCFPIGLKKIISQAQAFECSVIEDDIVATDVDNRWYNPHKYVWFYAPSECNEGDGLKKMVQYYKGKCF